MRLHHLDDGGRSNRQDSSAFSRVDVYTKRLHNRAPTMVRKRDIYHVRKRVPKALVVAMGKREIWKSLRTDSEVKARRRSYSALAQIESELASVEQGLGLNVDQALLLPLEQRSGLSSLSVKNLSMHQNVEQILADSITLGEVLQRFLADPTQKWSPRTRLAYETTARFMTSLMGEATLMKSLTRAVCRDFLETLRYLPKGASRAFPDLTPREAAQYAKRTGFGNVISAANANTYLNKVCVVFNWAVREEYLVRNHLKGLRLADPVSRVEKRLPFTDQQLQAIFSAPLFVGCRNDKLGYAQAGDAKPRGTRFWVPLIALFTGMRLNEICQLDVTDVRTIEGVACFSISERSLVGSEDKHLKTSTSERIVPVHPYLLQLGLFNFVNQRAGAGQTKLFFDICPGRDGFRSTAFSKWFVLFLEKANARQPRTSFHSFRHSFRDALRRGRVDREIAMCLGGWGTGTKSGLDVADYYGRGFEITALADAIQKLSFEHINALRALINSTES